MSAPVLDYSRGTPGAKLANIFRQPIVATFIVCALLYTIASLKYQGFFASQVFVNFFTDNAFLGIASVGMTFVILSGGIDLSVGSVIAFTSCFVGTLTQQNHINPIVAIVLALLAGSLFGLLQGCLIYFFDLEPFLVTLAGMFLARGIAMMITLSSISIDDPLLAKLSDLTWTIWQTDIRLTGMVFVTVLLIGIYIARYTGFGRNVYAIGGNQQSAALMGLPIARTKILVYTLSGFCSALAGIVFIIYLPSGDPRAAIGLELDSIAAVVIGGTLLTGGVGSVAGTLLGILILGIIQTAITFQGTLSSWWTKIAIGFLLLLFIALQRLLTKSKR